MKILQFIQRVFALIGFDSNHSVWKIEHLVGFALTGLAIPSFFIFLFHVADTIKEFTDSIYITAVAITIFISFVNTILKKSKLTLLFNMLEENVNNSKYLINC